jgi:hypothetical protein
MPEICKLLLFTVGLDLDFKDILPPARLAKQASALLRTFVRRKLPSR